ncbi:hypothetical protein PsYK624_162530 [Phanerochaete sordida]|uniref:TLC domain-containing protein n=1 Tax=Phanerochaete sordida TaxID=48140 RepID=A0A9P3GSF8_9APHY|nr:hypothetical protein PsYK624_162530 [Phanerochaete sordida]
MSALLSTVSRLAPTPNPHLVAVTAASLGACIAFYYVVEGAVRVRGKAMSERQRSWVLSTLSSAIMTLVSLPFLWHWLKTGETDILHAFADHACCFFIGYLASDLLVGSIHYRGSINLLTGWIHHFVYMSLLTFIVIPNNFSTLFSTLSILELPTFLLAAGSLNPVFRNDYLFAAVFFSTRICFHIYIAATYALRALSPAGGSWVPTIALSCVLPMHVLWMHGCVAGILRRRRAARHARAGTGVVAADPRVRDIPAYLLSRTLVSSALAQMRQRRLASTTLLRRSRQHVLRLLHDALRAEELAGAQASAAQAQVPQPPPKWRSIRRRVAGRIRRSLPEYDGGVAPAVVELDDAVVALATAVAQ